ncbi:PEP-utilizing enzyme [Streptomyces sp. NRRL WC-3744]|uniref:PEP-utilizing enzyme n=1 Tax=Streptomyces sp. NRRL WC-3744 TaxID=1463935 RepID=UPI003B64294A
MSHGTRGWGLGRGTVRFRPGRAGLMGVRLGAADRAGLRPPGGAVAPVRAAPVRRRHGGARAACARVGRRRGVRCGSGRGPYRPRADEGGAGWSRPARVRQHAKGAPPVHAARPVGGGGRARRHGGRLPKRGPGPSGGGFGVGTAWHGQGACADDAVLVTDSPDPALAPRPPDLAGLVADTDSVLSHPAVMTREYRVPRSASRVRPPLPLGHIPGRRRRRRGGHRPRAAQAGPAPAAGRQEPAG